MKDNHSNRDRAAKISFDIFVLSLGIISVFLIVFTSGSLSFATNRYYFLQALGMIFAYFTLLLLVGYGFSYLMITKKWEKCGCISKIPLRFRKLSNVFFYTFWVGLSALITLFLIGNVWIGFDVKNLCQETRAEYGGDCVISLSALLNDDTRGFRARNSAVWALGQLGDDRAQPVLHQYYTGKIPDREPLDEMISQYELKKAIKLTDGGINVSTWLWRSARQPVIY
jgi:hypothetical protein